MFLEYSELKTVAPLDIINLIVNEDQTTVETIIKESIALIKTYLSSYDVDWLFSLTGENRKKELVKHLKNITIYEIYCLRSTVVNEVIERRYSETMRFLEHVSQGKISPGDWTPPSDDPEEENDDDSPFLFFTGKDRYNTSF